MYVLRVSVQHSAATQVPLFKDRGWPLDLCLFMRPSGLEGMGCFAILSCTRALLPSEIAKNRIPGGVLSPLEIIQSINVLGF